MVNCHKRYILGSKPTRTSFFVNSYSHETRTSSYELFLDIRVYEFCISYVWFNRRYQIFVKKEKNAQRSGKNNM